MEFSHRKQSFLLRNLLIPSLIIAVAVFVFRLAYMLAIRGESCDFGGNFCFFSSSENLLTVTGVDQLQIPATESVISATGGFDFHTNYSLHLFYSSVFLDLMTQGFLSPSSRSLCVDTSSALAVLALKEIGVEDAVAAMEITSEQYFISEFDFIFSGSGGLQLSKRPFDHVSAISTALKSEGTIVVHTTSFDSYSLNSLHDLFDCCSYIRLKKIKSYDSSSPYLREVVFKKMLAPQPTSSAKPTSGECSVAGYKREAVENAEPLIKEEPMKPWITLKKNMGKMKYLPSMVDISFKRRYIYIDVGSRSYGSSIVSWFKKQYPKQDKEFEVYAIEADRVFHERYRGRKGVTLVPYAAWVKNETLLFDVGGEKKGKSRGMGRILPAGGVSHGGGNVEKIEGFDFAEFVKRSVTDKDYVVMKMDVEGIEFELIQRLMETGALCLLDEVFLECHYNRWQRCCPGERSSKYEKTYSQCLELFGSLRRSGVLVHQWW